MSAPFTFTSPNPLLAQTAGSEEIVYRSDNAADTGSLSVTGLSGAVSTTNTAALTGKREVKTADIFDPAGLTILKLSASQTGTVSVYDSGTAATGDLRVDTLPANNDTLIIGLTGFLQTYTFKTALTGGGATANEILIAANVTNQATYIYEAINKGANGGTHYGSATVANAYVVATAPTVGVIPLTDRIPVARQLTWALSQGTGATISIRTMIGGVTGTLLAELSPGTTMAYDSFSLATPDLAADTLPAKFTGSSDAISVNGRPFILQFYDDGTGNGSVAATYQRSVDGTSWSAGITAITDELDSGNGLNNPQVIIPAELMADYVRLTITANTNTIDLPIDGRAMFG